MSPEGVGLTQSGRWLHNLPAHAVLNVTVLDRNGEGLQAGHVAIMYLRKEIRE